MSVVAPEVEAAARARTLEYLRVNGTLVPAATLRRRVAQSFETLEKVLRPVDAARAARRAWPAEWSVHEIGDHVLETHRPSLAELRELLAGHRPAGPPVPASLQSPTPLARPWRAILDELHDVHAAIVAALAAAADELPTDVRAPVVVVINAEATDGSTVPLVWEDEIDWKAYAVFLRLHAVDHFNQARKVLAALSP
ncbi:MAG TPA: DinB family protein [Methylomirabilota bacterium]|nr:DinB family protein [Methylomirabilota bacterium]